MSAMRAGAEKRPSTRDSRPGRSDNANATAKNAAENAIAAISRPAASVAGSKGFSISKAVEEVRGMARNGPMVRYMSPMNTEANSGLTRPASSRTPPHTATATMPSTGSPMPAARKPAIAGIAASPACRPSSGGRMRLPAPKNIENSMPPTASS